jgi:hypothetical protein
MAGRLVILCWTLEGHDQVSGLDVAPMCDIPRNTHLVLGREVVRSCLGFAARSRHGLR